MLIHILLFSSAITLGLTALQLYADYRRDVAAIEARLQEIEHSSADSIARSLWYFDAPQIRVQIEGIRRLPEIRRVEVREGAANGKTALNIITGERSGTALLTREFPLSFVEDGKQPVTLGVLRVEATLDEVYHRLRDKALLILFSQGVKTFLVSLFILYIVHQLITRHLIDLTSMLGHLDISRTHPAFSLRRRKPAHQDELDQLADALNAARAGLEKAYADLRDANETLEQRVAQRTQALSESETRFRDFTETASDWFWETDADQRFTAFSARLADLTGLRPEAVIGKQRRALISATEIARNPEKWAEHDAVLEAHQAFRNFEYGGHFSDGSYRCFRISGKPIFDSEGRFQGYRGTGADITTLQATQNELLRSEKLASLGGLVAGIAHEINTPIGIGLTGASYLEGRTLEIDKRYSDGSMKRSELEKYFKSALEATGYLTTNLRRAADLVNSFKQVAVDQSSEQRRSFLLRHYLDEIITSLHPKLKRTRHEVRVDCAEDLELDSYPGAFSQIITNLLINSLIHGFDGIEAGRIDIAARVEANQLRLTYTDNGRGMTADNAKHIFEPFFTTKRGQGGSGLGLHVIYNLVTQQLDGHIDCHTAPDAGIDFKFRIPVKEEQSRVFATR